jgi:hypothetical protein
MFVLRKERSDNGAAVGAGDVWSKGHMFPLPLARFGGLVKLERVLAASFSTNHDQRQ